MNWYIQAQLNRHGEPLEFQNRTDVPFYDDLLSEKELDWYDHKTQQYTTGPKKQYMKEVKNRTANVQWMSPDDYINRCIQGFYEDYIDNNQEAKGQVPKCFKNISDCKEKILNSRQNIDLIREYSDRWMSGEKPPMVYLTYKDGKFYGQEGLHRAIMAKQLGLEKIPVLVANE